MLLVIWSLLLSCTSVLIFPRECLSRAFTFFNPPWIAALACYREEEVRTRYLYAIPFWPRTNHKQVSPIIINKTLNPKKILRKKYALEIEWVSGKIYKMGNRKMQCRLFFEYIKCIMETNSCKKCGRGGGS